MLHRITMRRILRSILFCVLSACHCGAFIQGSRCILLAESLAGCSTTRNPRNAALRAGRRRLSMKAETDDDGEWLNAGLLRRKGRSAPVQRVIEPISDVPSVSIGERDWGRFAGVSVMGYKGTTVARTSNQDSILAGEIGERSSLFAVFDGHGDAGHDVSRYLAKHASEAFTPIARAMEAAAVSEDDLSKMMAAAMSQLHKDVCQQPFDSLLSGSTGIVVMVTERAGGERQLVVGNVGDCRCVLAWRGFGGKLTTSQLSVDQTPDRPDEQKRIEGCGGVVGMIDLLPDPPRVISMEEASARGVNDGPARVFFKENEWEPPHDTCFPGLAMSRSLGDSILDELGVLPTPEVTVRDIKAKDLFVVMASDGVWQVMSNEEVARTVEGAAGQARRACEAIYAEAATRWEQEATGPYRDDISSFVIFLQRQDADAAGTPQGAAEPASDVGR
mmetsp:Transcript_11649/g.24056  ORF Transcript_11649/g.24056 Transcript_11649/m.24056 type:complete len:446 (+) Transcript_11649:136-1473(+)